MHFFIFKALHIIGAVAWFAGLFYLVRIFVYHAEAKEKPEPERSILILQFQLMEGRVFKLIANPAMLFTVVCGTAMLVGNPAYLQMGWLQLKLLFLVALLVYHFYCKNIIAQLEAETSKHTSFQFRLLNEVPTLFLVAIVLLAVLKNNSNAFYLLGGIFLLAILFYVLVKKYKKHRERSLEKMKSSNLTINDENI